MKERRSFEQFQDWITKLYPEYSLAAAGSENKCSTEERRAVRTITFQVTDDCSLACTYCYQINKGKRKMSWEVAKLMVDKILSGEAGFKEYLGDPLAIILEFIGGEPFLEIDLIDKIVDYFREQAILKNHRWAEMFAISICSNGVAYRDEKVQKFLQKNANNISFNVTVDGTKELHDACRVFPDGSPSYDLAHDAAMDWKNRGYEMGSKITMAPSNVKYLSDCLKQMIYDGYYDINANCVFEEGWTIEDAQEIWKQGKEFSDWIRNSKYDQMDYSVSFLNYETGRPMEEKENRNWCWATGTPILTTKGYKPIEEISIGDEVYTEDGTIHPVVNVMSHEADNVVKISAPGIFSMMCTDDHQVFCKPFDYRGYRNKKHYKDYQTCAVKDLTNKDLIPLFTLPDKNRTVHMDKNIAYILGRYIADGYLNNAETSPSSVFSIGKKKADTFEEALRESGVEYSRHPYKSTVTFYCKLAGTNANDIINQLAIECGRGAINKHIPESAWNWDNESLTALINGYMSGDGCEKTVKSKNKSAKMFCCNTVSKRLAQELQVILRTIGVNPTCYCNHRDGSTMEIEGRTVNVHNRYEIYWYEHNNRGYQRRDENNNLWTYGLKVEEAPAQTVYNITVDTNHSYIAGGIKSKNCGGNAEMLACDPEGRLYPCIRYMESSLGEAREPVVIGNVWSGLIQTPEEIHTMQCMRCIDRRSQSTDECFYCPVADGCAWCSAYNYQVSGTVDKRCTYICETHKARALLVTYYWNHYYHNKGEDKNVHDLWVPKQWAVPIMGEEEYEKLRRLTLDMGGYVNDSDTMIKNYVAKNQQEKP